MLFVSLDSTDCACACTDLKSFMVRKINRDSEKRGRKSVTYCQAAELGILLKLNNQNGGRDPTRHLAPLIESTSGKGLNVACV